MINENITKLLGDVKVGIEDINKYITQQGVVVRVSVGGGRNSYHISPKIYGIKENKLTDEGKEFMDEHIRNGSIVFIPKNYEKKLRAIESKLKKQLRELSVGYDNTFLPLTSYTEFKEYFDKCKSEYFQIRDELVERYSSMHERFITIAKQSLKDLEAYNAENELQNIINKLPNKEEFKNSFKMKITVSAFPTIENIDMFDENIQEDIMAMSKRDTDDLVKDATVSVINEGVMSLSSVIKNGSENDRIHQRVLYGLKNGIERMSTKNIFANQKLESMRDEMIELSKKENDDVDSIVEFAERILANLYNYAIELKISNDINLKNCPFSKEKLISVYELYN